MPEHTTPDGRENRRTDADRETLADCNHTNPYTDESFGDAMVYQRGPVVVADGGEARAAEEPVAADEATADEREDDETLGDVDHTPPRDADDANRVHERGGEAPDDV